MVVSTVLVLHVIAGFISLAAAGVALATAKGRQAHRRAGSAYVIGMAVVSLTALVLSLLRPSVFLFVVAVFSFFLVFTGWRAARVRDGKPRWPDHLAGGVMVLAALIMLTLGVVGLAGTGPGESRAVILLIFGAIGLVLPLVDWREWRNAASVGQARIIRHLGRMLAGTIATITAAVVVNFTFLPDLVVWLGPTVLITPWIFWWSARVTRGAGGMS